MTKDEREFLGRGCAMVLLIGSGATILVTVLAVVFKALAWILGK